MKTKIAVRNLRLCTKDCLCLYVCPTGASDTENSIIDTEKCIGCGYGAGAWSPAGPFPWCRWNTASAEKSGHRAGSFPRPDPKQGGEEKMALQIAETTEDDALCRLMTAVAKSVRLVNEDLLRESGYMLPQSGNTHDLLKGWVANPPLLNSQWKQPGNFSQCSLTTI